MQSFVFNVLKYCATLASGWGGQRKLFILIYHQVLDQPDFMRPDEVDTTAFTWQMQLLSGYFNVLPLDQALAGLQDGSLPPRAVTITFDDGYADNLHNAVPILKQYGLTATFFIATGYLDGGRMWNDTVIEAIRNVPQPELDLTAIGLGVFSLATPQQKAETARIVLKKLKHLAPPQRLAHSQFIAEHATHVPDDLMLTSEELKILHRQGMEIGGHTVNHPILAKLDDRDAVMEISGNKSFLEQLLGISLRFFAYPNGKLEEDYRLEHRDIVKRQAYQAALSTQAGVADAQSDLWQLPRFTPWDGTPIKFMLRMIQMYFVH